MPSKLYIAYIHVWGQESLTSLRTQLPWIVSHVLGRGIAFCRRICFLLTICWRLLVAPLWFGFWSRLRDRLALCQLHEELAHIACAINGTELGFEELCFTYKSVFC
jgi:hypothetical protein